MFHASLNNSRRFPAAEQLRAETAKRRDPPNEVGRERRLVNRKLFFVDLRLSTLEDEEFLRKEPILSLAMLPRQEEQISY